MIRHLILCFIIINLNISVSAQTDYCWFSYRPNLKADSLMLLGKHSKIDMYQISKKSRNKYDTIYINSFKLNSCKNDLLKDCFIKKEKKKKHKLKHVIEHKYSGYRYKLIHYYNDKRQILKTINKLKKGDDKEEFLAFSKLKYEYNKDGYLKKLRFYLEDYTHDKQDYLHILFTYE